MILAAVISLYAGDTLNATAREEIALAVEASDLMFAAHPGDKMLLGVHSIRVRKAGRLDEALQLAERAWATEQNFMSAIAIAIARKLKGDVDGAVEGYRQVMRFESNPADRCADIAATLGRARRYGEALPWAQEAIRHCPDHVRALAYAMLLRAKIEPHPQRMEEVRRFVRDCGGSADPDFMAELQPYVDYLPPPQEATLGVARHVLQARGDKPGGITSLGLSSMESPSSRLAVEMAPGMKRGSMPVEVAQIQTPDPRQPRQPLKYLLWRYDGTDPRPAIPLPPGHVLDPIAALARETFDIEAWTRRAADVARDTGPGHLESVLAVMVHPSPPPENEKTWIWIPHLQLAAALVAARIDGGWEGSLRRDALLSLVYGPDDWTTVAGIVAITQVALELGRGPAAEEGYHALLNMAHSIPRPGYCCWEFARSTTCAAIPPARTPSGQQAGKWLNKLEDNN
jgi:tetratricopeptide (TPR) repeat protein